MSTTNVAKALTLLTLAALASSCRDGARHAVAPLEIGRVQIEVHRDERNRTLICEVAIDGHRLTDPHCLGPITDRPGPQYVLARLDDHDHRRALLVVRPGGGEVLDQNLDRAHVGDTNIEVLARVSDETADTASSDDERLLYRWSGRTAVIHVLLSRRVVHPGEAIRGARRSPSSG